MNLAAGFLEAQQDAEKFPCAQAAQKGPDARRRDAGVPTEGGSEAY
jgi:hypothetical protein